MDKTKWIFFDLDGTLTDSAPGMAESFTYVFNKYGIDIGGKDIRYFMGPPVSHSFGAYFDTEEQLLEAIRDFRAHYGERMLSGNRVYDGVGEMLEALTDSGYKLTVVTGKPQDSAEQVINHFSLGKYFDGIYGIHDLNTPKIETLTKAIQIHKCIPSQVTMIGDRMFDLEAAMLGKTDGIGVLWGYGDRDELERYDYRLLAHKPSEIMKHFEV